MHRASPPSRHGSVNRPLTVGGADRRLCFVAVVAGGATFTFVRQSAGRAADDGGALRRGAVDDAARSAALRIVLRAATSDAAI